MIWLTIRIKDLHKSKSRECLSNLPTPDGPVNIKLRPMSGLLEADRL